MRMSHLSNAVLLSDQARERMLTDFSTERMLQQQLEPLLRKGNTGVRRVIYANAICTNRKLARVLSIQPVPSVLRVPANRYALEKPVDTRVISDRNDAERGKYKYFTPELVLVGEDIDDGLKEFLSQWS